MEVDVREFDAEWKAELSPDQYQVLRRAATEPPWVGRYVTNHQDGTYRCAGCTAVLFDADTKFESGSGWPSFYQPAALHAVELVVDRGHDMARTEVRCRRCRGHLDHLFDDGPEPTRSATASTPWPSTSRPRPDPTAADCPRPGCIFRSQSHSR
ncbi:MAG: peptide-methionine (R)-S-oxide reductase MsrB [Acidimicrobiales bacterium]